MNNKPLVSIIIPTYNRAHLIEETLDSVIAQTYHNWECIIVDDGSSDHTDDVVGDYVKKDSRFKYFHRPDEHLPGGNGARNYGFKMSQGEYVNWLDSDDLFSETGIYNLVSSIDNFNACVGCYSEILNGKKSKRKSLDYENKIVLNDFYTKYIKRELDIGISNILWKRFILKKQSILFDESLYRMQEYEFYSRLLSSIDLLVFIPNNIFYYKRNNNSISNDYNKQDEKKILSTIQVLNRIVQLSINNDTFKELEIFFIKRFKNEYKKVIKSNDNEISEQYLQMAKNILSIKKLLIIKIIFLLKIFFNIKTPKKIALKYV